FAAETAQVEQPGAANFGRTHHVDLVDHLGVNRKDAFDALPKADLADGETGLRSVVALDDYAFKRLHAFLVAFLDLHMDPDGVSRPECGDVGALRFSQQFFDD